VLAALRDEPRIRFITTRHEQATSYMADGYARAGGGIGTALVVPGPGLLNAAAGLSTAYSASSPVLILSGQIPREQIGKNIGLLHEVNDQLNSIAPVTKWRRRVLEVAEIPAAVRAAVQQLKTGRPRPVEIELPPETMEEEGDVELLDPVRHVRPAANAADVDRAAQMLLAAREPVIYAGGGVHLSGAHEALAAVAEYLQSGVIQSAEGKGAVNDDSDLSLGATIWSRSTLKQYLEKADLVLAVGSRCALAGFRPDQQVIQIDIDSEEIGRNHKKTFGLLGDARATLEELLERLRTTGAPRSPRKAEREALRAAIAATDVQEMSTVRTRFGPNRSPSQPTGTWPSAYAQVNAARTRPICASDSPNAARISGCATEMMPRSKYAIRYIRLKSPSIHQRVRVGAADARLSGASD